MTGYTEKQLLAFVKESNRIEGINRRPTKTEIEEAERFLELETIKVSDLERFVQIYQHGAKLRDRVRMDVRVGLHDPPPGGPEIRETLEKLLKHVAHPYLIHQTYETLHPFMDGNGRSGRILWAQQMLQAERWPRLELGFLHAFYYQALEFSRGVVL